MEFVYRADYPPVYRWYVYKTERHDSYNLTSYWLNLTSQRWYDGKWSASSAVPLTNLTLTINIIVSVYLGSDCGTVS